MKVIKNYNLLQEDYRSDDLFDSKISTKSVKRRLDEVTSPAIFALVGPFGSGKSTLLYQLEKEKISDEIWLHFDAWKYPDRSDLWEGMVLDIADQLGKLKGVKRKIEGSTKGGQVVDLVSDIASLLSGIPGLNIFDKLVKVFKSSPAKRVFEIQNVLKDLLSIDSGFQIKIVIEDIDRSGDAGVYFLETLNHFLKNTELENDVIAIVPISNESYEVKLDSYLKCVDYFEFLNSSVNDVTLFISQVFDDNLFVDSADENKRETRTGSDVRKRLNSFIVELFRLYPSMNGRLLKLGLRDFASTFAIQEKDAHQPDWQVTLCLQMSKYLKATPNEQSFFKEFKARGRIDKSNVFSAYLYAIYANNDEIVQISSDNINKELNTSPYSFKFYHRIGDNYSSYPSSPYKTGNFGREEGFGVCSFYLQY